MSLITFTSDLGNQDSIAAAIKGRFFIANDSFHVIDNTHCISAFNLPQAAYLSRTVIENFPEGSLHLVLVNVFDSKPKHMLLAEHNGQYIGCADNGLLTMILEGQPQKVVALPFNDTEGRTILHCADKIAEAYNKLLQGKKLEAVGDATVEIVTKNRFRAKLGADWMEAQIIYVDNFENVVVNIHKSAFEEQRNGRKFKIVFKRDEVIEKISESYADVAEGEKLALFNTAGYLEIAINKGNAAGLLGLQHYAENHSVSAQLLNNRLIYQMVQIQFE